MSGIIEKIASKVKNFGPAFNGRQSQFFPIQIEAIYLTAKG